MADFRAVQRVRLFDGTNDIGFALGNPLYVSLSDGTDTALIDASGNVNVILAANSGVDIGDVDVTSVPAPLNVVGGGTEAAALRVTIANNSTGLVSVDDGGGSLTVDGSVTVSATDLDIRDLSKDQDDVLVYANTVKDGSGTDYIPLVDTDGHLQVDILSGGGSNASVKVDDSAFTIAVSSVTAIGAIADETATDSVDEGDVGAVRMTLDRKLLTRVVGASDANRLDIDASGNAKAILAANSGVDIGDVDVTSVPAPLSTSGGGTEAAALRVTIANDSTGVLSIDDNGSSITVDGTVAATQSGTWNIATVTTLTGITNDVNIADGGNSITVDATNLDIRTITKATDSIQISKDTSANAETNPIYVHNVNTVTSGNEIHDYDASTATAKDASSNHDYTVTGTTMLLKSVICAASGSGKYEVQVGPLASLVTKAVQFGSASKSSVVFEFNPPIEVPVTSTGTVRVIRRNDANQAQDMYSTIIGNDV